MVGRLGRVKKKESARRMMGGSFPSSHRPSRDCYFFIIAIFTGVPRGSLCGGERYKKSGCQSNKKESHRNLFISY